MWAAEELGVSAHNTIASKPTSTSRVSLFLGSLHTRAAPHIVPAPYVHDSRLLLVSLGNVLKDQNRHRRRGRIRF